MKSYPNVIDGKSSAEEKNIINRAEGARQPTGSVMQLHVYITLS